MYFYFIFFFFFSSRRRHTRSKRDWSSDVCSSDLSAGRRGAHLGTPDQGRGRDAARLLSNRFAARRRSEERRVGKECRSRWGAEQEKKKRRINGSALHRVRVNMESGTCTRTRCIAN